MKSWIVHYKNKFPGALVVAGEDYLDVHFGDEHLIALRKDGSGSWVDMSAEYGCSERHDLAPIPRDARVHKVVDNKVGLDELHEERKGKLSLYMEGRKVLSMAELKAKGYEFDEKGRVAVHPKKI